MGLDRRPCTIMSTRDQIDAAGSPEGRRAPGRPRSELARTKILDAAYEILRRDGIASFSIDAVATRSGVARTTIYRWWPTKGALAIESFLNEVRPHLVFRQSDAPEADFRTLVLSLATTLSGQAGQVAASVIAQAQYDPETQAQFREAFSDPLRAQSAVVLRSGIDQGALRADLDVGRIIDAFVGAIYLRLLLGSSLTPEWGEALCETLLRGCADHP